MSTYPRTPEEFTQAWEEINQEMLEEGTPVFIKIPTIKQTQTWIDNNTDA